MTERDPSDAGPRSGVGVDAAVDAEGEGGQDRDHPDAPGPAPAAPVDEGTSTRGHATGFQQATAMLDDGEFLGELADVQERFVPTRARVEVGPGPAGFRLIVVRGPELGAVHEFGAAEVVLGRDPDVALALADIDVSRRHARIVRTAAGFRLEDLGSENGCFLNGARIESALLSSGDEIVLGGLGFRFVVLTEAPDAERSEPAPEAAVGPPPGDAALDGLDSVAPGDAAPGGSLSAAPDSGGGAAGSVVARGRGLRGRSRMLLGAGLVALVLGVSGRWALRAYDAYQARARAERIRLRFLQAVRLTQADRCGDALLLLERVLRLAPEHERAREYQTHCEAEVARYRCLESARAVAGALPPCVDQIPPESAYRDAAQTLKKRRASKGALRWPAGRAIALVAWPPTVSPPQTGALGAALRPNRRDGR